MSRSLKKTPGCCCEGPGHLRWAKRQANKKVRRTKDIPNGKAYRIVYDPWNIRDYTWHIYTEAHVQDYLEMWDEKRYRIFAK